MSSKNRLINRERYRRVNGGRYIALIVLDVVIVILCLVLAFALWFMICNFKDEQDTVNDAYLLHSAMATENYTWMRKMSKENQVEGIGGNDSDYVEYYAVADYFEALTRYYMYDKAGDDVRAEKWKERMEEAESKMGSLRGEKERIKNWLGIIQ